MQDRLPGTGHSAYFRAAELLADQLDDALTLTGAVRNRENSRTAGPEGAGSAR
jgi:hypothetical protein